MKVLPPRPPRWLWPLASRKVQVALATIIVAYAAEAGWIFQEDTVVAVLSVGVALILGIAHEDAAAKRGKPECSEPRS
jgi:hypothetical protein